MQVHGQAEGFGAAADLAVEVEAQRARAACSRTSGAGGGRARRRRAWPRSTARRSSNHPGVTSPRSRFCWRTSIWRARSTISGWWFTANTRGISPLSSRANSSMVSASPGGPPDAAASRSRSRACPRAAAPARGRGRRAGGRARTARRRSGSSSARRPNQGWPTASGVSTFSRMPALLPPFSAERSTGRATPDHRHITPNVWHTATRRALRRGLDLVEQREQARLPGGILHDALACPGAAPSLRCGIDVARARRCRGRARSGRPAAPGSCGCGARRRRARARGGRSPEPRRSGRRPRPAPRGPASRGPGWASRGSCPARRRPRRARRAAGTSDGASTRT